MSEAFFESPIYVYLALGFALLVLAAVWYERRSRRLAWAMVVPVILAVAVGFVARLVVTDREQIADAARHIADAAGTGQLQVVPQYIDDAFLVDLNPYSRGGYTKENVVSLIQGDVHRYGVTKVSIAKTDIEVTGRKAAMHVQTMIHYGGERGYKAPFIWDVTWIKRDDGWKVLEVTSVKQALEF